MKSDTFAGRIEILLERLNLTQNGLADEINQPATSIYNYTGKRKSEPSFGFLQKLKARFPQVDMNYIVAGESEPVLRTDIASEPTIQYIPKLLVTGELVDIPIIDMQAAANAIQGIEKNEPIETIDMIKVPSWWLKPGLHICLRARGNSMHPIMHDGTHVVFRKLDRFQWKDFKNNYVHLIYSNVHGAQVKYLRRVERSHRHVMLDSENSDENQGFMLDFDEIQQICEMEFYVNFKVFSNKKQIVERLDSLESAYRDIAFEIDAIKKHKS